MEVFSEKVVLKISSKSQKNPIVVPNLEKLAGLKPAFLMSAYIFPNLFVNFA